MLCFESVCGTKSLCAISATVTSSVSPEPAGAPRPVDLCCYLQPCVARVIIINQINKPRIRPKQIPTAHLCFKTELFCLSAFKSAALKHITCSAELYRQRCCVHTTLDQASCWRTCKPDVCTQWILTGLPRNRALMNGVNQVHKYKTTYGHNEHSQDKSHPV